MRNLNSDIIAKNINQLAEEKNYKQCDLAKIMEISQPRMSRLMNGKNIPTLDEAYKLSKVFGITIDELISEPSSTPKYQITTFADVIEFFFALREVCDVNIGIEYDFPENNDYEYNYINNKYSGIIYSFGFYEFRGHERPEYQLFKEMKKTLEGLKAITDKNLRDNMIVMWKNTLLESASKYDLHSDIENDDEPEIPEPQQPTNDDDSEVPF